MFSFFIVAIGTLGVAASVAVNFAAALAGADHAGSGNGMATDSRACD